MRETLTQRELALQLRTAIDTAIRDEGLTRSLIVGVAAAARARIQTNEQRIAALIQENPHGFQSRHVRHNLGKRRWAWLKGDDVIKFYEEERG